MNASRLLGGLSLAAAISLTGFDVAAHDRRVRHTHLLTTVAPEFERFNMVWYQDIAYDHAPNTEAHLLALDIYSLEPQPANAPVMVFVHGGGSRTGDKAWSKDLGAKPEHFMRREGYVFVSVNYRLGDAGRYPVAQQDVANALAWVHNNIAQYGGNPNQIFFSGHSAGAALIARVATNDTFLKKAGKDLSIIKAAITIDGGNFDVMAGAKTEEGKQQLVSRLGPNAADWERSAPLTHIAKGKGIPPWLFLHIGNGGPSEKDAVTMATALRGSGLRADVVELIGKDHFQANEAIGVLNDPATIAVHRFLTSVSGRSENLSSAR